MFLFVLFILSVLTWLWYNITFAKRIQIAERYPGPKLSPLLGNALLFGKWKPEEMLDNIGELCKKYGGLFRVWIGPFNLSFVSTNAQDVETILSSTQHIKKSNMYAMLVPWLGDGLLLSYGRKWQTRRRIITPAFHFKVLEDFLGVFQTNTNIMRDLLLKEVSESRDHVLDIYPFINRCTLDIICETAMGIELRSQTNREQPYTKAVLRISEIVWTRWMEKMWLRSDFLFKWLGFGLFREHEECLRTLHEFTDNIIRQRRRACFDAAIDLEVDEQLGIKRKEALLDILLKASVDGIPLTDEEIREEVDTFMFEGHDTTASAIGFTLYFISKNPRVQEKMYEEIQTVLGGREDNRWTQGDLAELKYMELVMKESMRLYPPVAFLGRRIEEDFELNGRIIPAKTNLAIGVYQMGRDESVFADPQAFIPERFANPTFDPYSYVPWSRGPRDCIGRRFATLEVKNVLVMLLSNFELFDANFKPKVVANVVLRSTNGISVGMRRRR